MKFFKIILVVLIEFFITLYCQDYKEFNSTFSDLKVYNDSGESFGNFLNKLFDLNLFEFFIKSAKKIFNNMPINIQQIFVSFSQQLWR